jgi:hypothetical protein
MRANNPINAFTLWFYYKESHREIENPLFTTFSRDSFLANQVANLWNYIFFGAFFRYLMHFTNILPQSLDVLL